MKISVVYNSQGGNTKKIAERVVLGSASVGGVEARVMNIDDIDEKFIEGSMAVIFGCPTYVGSISWQMKKFLDTTFIGLEGKLCGVFATADYHGGGAENAELAMIGSLLVRGMLVYSAGFTKGAPFTHFGAVAVKDGDSFQKERAEFIGKRIAEKALELFG